MLNKMPTENIFRLSSSLRSRSADESLMIAASLAKSRGISRVVDVTWLDRIGIPVYSSIRPDGIKGSLCVHAGKGFTHAEAKIGAYMEAIEFSFAEPGRNVVNYFLRKPSDILASFQHQIQFADFCPILGQKVCADDDIAVVKGNEIMAGLGDVLVPAELIFHPFFDNPGVKLYGSSTNGLASGNNLAEATVHGLAEIMERHVRAFEVFDDQSVRIEAQTCPPKLEQMMAQIHRAGLQCHLRYSRNCFGLAYFSAYVLEPDEFNPIAVASGFGLHPCAEIAAIRAVAEAVQSRLSHIHGGRDDIIQRVQLGKDLGRDEELAAIRILRRMVASSNGEIPFHAVPSIAIADLSQAIDVLYGALKQANMHHVVQLPLTDSSYPFQVVRILVPGAEMFGRELQRVGPRLIQHVNSLKDNHVDKAAKNGQ